MTTSRNLASIGNTLQTNVKLQKKLINIFTLALVKKQSLIFYQNEIKKIGKI